MKLTADIVVLIEGRIERAYQLIIPENYSTIGAY
jgi:hypothetical protein